MTVKELKEKLDLQYICNENIAEEKTVTGCYCGDLLSWVMSRATEGDAWLTVMGNVTSIGVAVLADVACIILTENAPADADAIKRAEENEVIILSTDKNSYAIAVEISKLI
ncbi:MAG: DRTGG domain-containing protein [Acutalibacteraceae bacterium]|nr:DRTGG domain-containing protein [Acutalibacteraceae bacterium]